MRKCAFVVLCLFAVFTCQGAVFTVDDDGAADFDSIQQAIDESWHGDTIIVRPGLYAENVYFNGRAVTVTSEDPLNPGIVDSTVITAGAGYAVNFVFAEDSGSLLEGFTITGRGIFCDRTSPTIAMNIIKDCDTSGIYGDNDAEPNIAGNIIMDNLGGGVRRCDGDIIANWICGNTAVNGGGLYDCRGFIKNNIVSGNIAWGSGYDGDGGGLCYCDGYIINNTIVGNWAKNSAYPDSHGAGGGLYECGALVQNNIIAYNIANSNLGGGFYCRYSTWACTNRYNAYWNNTGGHFGGNLYIGSGSIIDNPRFADPGQWDPNGTYGDSSDDFWVEGDYHLRSEWGRWDSGSTLWVNDSLTSRCIDAGRPDTTDWFAELWPHGKRINMGAYGGTNEASMSPSREGLIADMDHDDWVHFTDLTLFAEKWLDDRPPVAPDLDRNGTVDFRDFCVFVDNWHVPPPTFGPPTPDPMTWETPPYATSPFSIRMVASQASSGDGTSVQYYFDNCRGGLQDSGWISERVWEVNDLDPVRIYGYTVKARNTGDEKETQPSPCTYVTTPQEDLDEPEPDPAEWQDEPYFEQPNKIKMSAVIATDESGVEYEFDCTSHPAYSSDWQNSPAYELSLPAGVEDTFSFVVRARDKSRRQNTTQPSIEASAEVDLKAPTPGEGWWEEEPCKYQASSSTLDWHVRMTAEEATDNSGTVEYFFYCTEEPAVWPSGFSSGWQSERSWDLKYGGQHVDIGQWKYKVRDAAGNESTFSPLVIPTYCPE